MTKPDHKINRRRFLAAGSVLLGTAPLSGLMQGAVAEPPSDAASRMLLEPAKRVPIVADVDVVVVGGGPAGIAAAITAAESGASVALIEVHGCLGGVWTAGLLTYVFDADKPGLNRRITAGLRQREGMTHTTPGEYYYQPERMKRLLEEMCLTAGVRVRLMTRLVAAVKSDDGRLTHVITESKSGREAWKARVFIDASGDGDLGAAAGCKYEIGRQEDCPCQPMTLNALVTVADISGVAPFLSFYGGDKSVRSKPLQLMRAELRKARVDVSYAKPTLFHAGERLLTLMINHEYGVRADDADAVTAATLRARGEVNTVVDGLRSLGGPWKTLELVATAEQIGVRDGRRIRGRDTMVTQDLIDGRLADDGVARVTFNVDVHEATKQEDQKQRNAQAGVKMKPYDIRLGTLMARDVDGLLLAGRCISGDFISHASYRVTGNAVAMGEAAGIAATMAASAKTLPHKLEARLVVAKLNRYRSGSGSPPR